MVFAVDRSHACMASRSNRPYGIVLATTYGGDMSARPDVGDQGGERPQYVVYVISRRVIVSRRTTRRRRDVCVRFMEDPDESGRVPTCRRGGLGERNGGARTGSNGIDIKISRHLQYQNID